MNKINQWNIDESWTLFLDRDGTINRRITGGYVTNWNEFEFLPGALESIRYFDQVFHHIIIVTNQQGIGKRLMSREDLQTIHDKMIEVIRSSAGRIDEIYYCPELEIYDPLCRKPNPGMALRAKEDFREIVFKKSIMVGDALSDMLFGKRLGMKTVFIGTNVALNKMNKDLIDLSCNSLLELAEKLIY